MFKHRPFRVEKTQLETRELSPRSALLVHQNSFAYSIDRPVQPDRPDKKKIHKKRKHGTATESYASLVTTASLCHVLAFADHTTGAKVLVHIDPGIDTITSLYLMMSYLAKNGVIHSPAALDDVLILKSLISYSDSIVETYLTLQLLGCQARVVRNLRFSLFDWVGCTTPGDGVVRFDNSSVQRRQGVLQSGVANKAIATEARRRRTLYCENTRRHEASPSFEIMRGVPAFAIVKGSEAGIPGSYTVNVPLNFDCYPFKVPMGRGVSIETVEHRDGNYLAISGRERYGCLSQPTIKRLRTALFAIAEQIATSKI